MNDILFCNQPIIPTENVMGKYWNTITHMYYGMEDTTAKYGVFDKPWDHYTGYDEFISYPDMKIMNLSHQDLCDRRAIDLFQLAQLQNKRIAIMWSGGIDSTLVLSSFIKNISTSDLDNLVVILNVDSILENPEFYKKFISGKISCIATYDLNITDEFLNKNMLLTGELGDGIYGPCSFIFLDLIKSGQHHLPWKTNSQLLVDMTVAWYNKFRQREYTPTIDHATEFTWWWVHKVHKNLLSVKGKFDEITDIGDWWWWNYYNFKWGRLIWLPFYNHKKDIKASISEKNCQDFLKNTFFNTDEFAIWSYSNLKNLVPADIRKHKGDAKKYIFDLDHNQSYFENKLKTPSRPLSYHGLFANKSICYDKNWIGYHSDDPLIRDFFIEKLNNYTG